MPDYYQTPNNHTGVGELDLNSPDIASSGKLPKGGEPKTRAIKDEHQCAQIVVNLEHENRDRSLKAARIMSKYNAEAPYSYRKLESDGLKWKANFSTQPLPALVNRIVPRISSTVEMAKYITSSKLPDDIPGAATKTEAFRREITEVARARDNWKDFIDEIVQENVLFGYTGVGWLDEYSWFPHHFRGDRFLLPAGTKQYADSAQLVCFVEHILPHDLYDQISDTEAARDAGWDVPNTVNAINNAMPENARVSASGDYGRMLEDLHRESNLGTSLRSGAKVVILYNILVYDVNGKVSHWKIRYPDYKVVFHRDDRFDRMSDVAAFFSFEQANGTMHGSKGVGRMVYNLAGMLDRARNEVVDRLQLSGKLVLQGDIKALTRFKMGVFGNAVLISDDFEISQQSIDPHVEEFFQLDQYISQIIDQLTGNLSPRHLQGERVTKAQVDLFAEREEEGKDAVISRFLSQFSRMVSTMQRRMVDPDIDDKDAKDMQKRLLEVMSREELDTLAESASANVVADLSDLERQRIIAIAAENSGNPLYDQPELARRKTIAQMDDEFAEAVLMPENDPVQISEQTRLQQMENLLLQTGQVVAVSPRDNHAIHLQALESIIQPLVDSLQEGLENVPILKTLLQHATEHVQQGLASGEEQGTFITANERINAIGEKIKGLVAHQSAIEEGINRGMSPEEAIAIADGLASGQTPGGMTQNAPPV